MYRKLIARYAAGLVEDGDSLFINTSRNALQMLDYIRCRNVTVITNNGKAIGREYYDGISIILTGGELRHPKDAMVGDFAIRSVQNVFPKKAFMDCSGISMLSGMTTEIAAEVKVNDDPECDRGCISSGRSYKNRKKQQLYKFADPGNQAFDHR